MSDNHHQRQNKDQDQKQRASEGQDTGQQDQDQDQELDDASLDEVTGGTTPVVTEEFPFLVVKNR